jgi:SAM-dependent methyltransferase
MIRFMPTVRHNGDQNLKLERIVMTLGRAGGLLPKPLKKFLKPIKREAIRSLKVIQEVRLRLCTSPLESLPGAPDLFRTYRYLHQHPEVTRTSGGWLFKGQFYPDYITVGGAGHAIFHEALRFCSGYGVDIGAGFWPLPGAVPVDSERGLGLGTNTSDFEDESLDYLFSSHCLEHIGDWQLVLHQWTRKLRPGGIIFLYLPHPGCEIWHPGSPFVGDGHKWIPKPDTVREFLEGIGCPIISFNDGPDCMWSFYVCGRREPKKPE